MSTQSSWRKISLSGNHYHPYMRVECTIHEQWLQGGHYFHRILFMPVMTSSGGRYIKLNSWKIFFKWQITKCYLFILLIHRFLDYLERHNRVWARNPVNHHLDKHIKWQIYTSENGKETTNTYTGKEIRSLQRGNRSLNIAHMCLWAEGLHATHQRELSL